MDIQHFFFFFEFSTKWVAQRGFWNKREVVPSNSMCKWEEQSKETEKEREKKKPRQNQVTMTEQKKYIYFFLFFSLEIWKLVSVWIILANAIGLLLFGIAIKVTSVSIATNLRYIGCSDLPSKYTTKVNSFKPSVSLDIVTSSTQVTKALGQIGRQ